LVKSFGKKKLPAILRIPSPQQERDRKRSLIEKRNLSNRNVIRLKFIKLKLA